MIEECDSCGYRTEVKEENAGPPTNQKAYMCDVCSNTLIGNAFFWPQQYLNESKTLRTIGWIANKLLDEIRQRK